MKVSAFIPCFNNATTILEAVESIKKQSYPISELFVVDDGSTDNSVKILRDEGIIVHTNKYNMGRGYTRKKALELANYPIVVCCDATNGLEKHFVKKSINFFKDKRIATISGRLVNKISTNSNDKWRARHLFHEDENYSSGPEKTLLLITYGTMLRKNAVIEVGNFDSTLKKCEDIDLGHRLISRGFTLLGHTDVYIYSLKSNTIFELYERYWRWYYSEIEKFTLKHFILTVKCSLKPMIQKDLRCKDIKSAFISLILPYYCLYRSMRSKK